MRWRQRACAGVTAACMAALVLQAWQSPAAQRSTCCQRMAFPCPCWLCFLWGMDIAGFTASCIAALALLVQPASAWAVGAVLSSTRLPCTSSKTCCRLHCVLHCSPPHSRG